MEPLSLPHQVTGPSDIARLQRELNGLNDFFVAAKARQTGTSMALPRLTRLLNQLALDNNINLLDEKERAKLTTGLNQLAEHAPTMHVSFASEPSPRAMEKLVVWIRANIHPQAMVQVGLQPSIAAGCFLRTDNKAFDMSLKATLKKSEPVLLELIKGAVDGR